ncbi:MAG: hypothetical protein WC533_01675 [Candidatus Pacearchaeota archaeon]
MAGVRPVFAHEVAMSTIFRTKKKSGKSKEIEKEALSELVFVDVMGKQVVARIALPFNVLEALPKMIDENIKKIKEELKNKEAPKKPIIETSNNVKNYFG